MEGVQKSCNVGAFYRRQNVLELRLTWESSDQRRSSRLISV
jgi:hypothetical protein